MLVSMVPFAMPALWLTAVFCEDGKKNNAKSKSEVEARLSAAQKNCDGCSPGSYEAHVLQNVLGLVRAELPQEEDRRLEPRSLDHLSRPGLQAGCS